MNFTNPTIYLITGDMYNDEKNFLELLKISLNKGIKLVQIRIKSLNRDRYKEVALQAVKLCKEYNATVLLSTYTDLINEVGADGVHLPSIELMKLNARPVSTRYLLSVACHNKEQVIHASNIGADFAVLCPVFATPSSPMGRPLGWKNFSSLVKFSKIPIYALGGVTPEDIEVAKSHGAIGIAAIRSVWGRE